MAGARVGLLGARERLALAPVPIGDLALAALRVVRGRLDRHLLRGVRDLVLGHLAERAETREILALKGEHETEGGDVEKFHQHKGHNTPMPKDEKVVSLAEHRDDQLNLTPVQLLEMIRRDLKTAGRPYTGIFVALVTDEDESGRREVTRYRAGLPREREVFVLHRALVDATIDDA